MNLNRYVNIKNMEFTEFYLIFINFFALFYYFSSKMEDHHRDFVNHLQSEIQFLREVAFEGCKEYESDEEEDGYERDDEYEETEENDSDVVDKMEVDGDDDNTDNTQENPRKRQKTEENVQ